MRISIPLLRINNLPQISPYLENVIYKKVNGLALRCFELITDWFLRICCCFYPAYRRLSKLQATSPCNPAGGKFVDTTGLLDRFPDKAERLHHFLDGTGILDLTAGKIFGWAHGTNQIVLNSRYYVFFHPHKYHDKSLGGFGRVNNTLYLTLEDHAGHPGQVKITEYKTGGRSIHWIIDTTKRFEKRQMMPGVAGVSPMITKAYVTEDAIPHIQDPNYLRREQE